jgi:hypothetical protein
MIKALKTRPIEWVLVAVFLVSGINILLAAQAGTTGSTIIEILLASGALTVYGISQVITAVWHGVTLQMRKATNIPLFIYFLILVYYAVLIILTAGLFSPVWPFLGGLGLLCALLRQV